YRICKIIYHSPTRGVMAEVKTELLWTTNVTPAPTNMAMYPASHANGYGRSACPPVLMTLWMTFATWPLRRELSSLTRSSRQVQRTAREAARRISPTVRSDSGDQQSSGYYPTSHF
uniref:Uncharacterized protein n=1 Tax=Lates calcarifer TaxID=8187 RepID=A0A4W6C523_LATCA